MDDKMMCVNCGRMFEPTEEQVDRALNLDAIYCPKCDKEIGEEIRQEDDKRSALVRQVLGLKASDTREK